jgi:hypothetical protein
MSIEKIKERIRMIENNDFTTNKIISEDLRGSAKDFKTIFTKADDKTIDNISKLDATLNKTNDLHSKWMGDNAPKITIDGRYSNKKEDIPNKDKNTIFKFYTELKNRNILPNDLTSNSFKPKNGYFRSKKGDTLTLFNQKLITLKFNDKKLTNLVGLIINRDKQNVSSTDFNDFFNEIDNNKTNYSVKNTQLTNGNDTIEINF